MAFPNVSWELFLLRWVVEAFTLASFSESTSGNFGGFFGFDAIGGVRLAGVGFFCLETFGGGGGGGVSTLPWPRFIAA
jgi:hypothetical protein